MDNRVKQTGCLMVLVPFVLDIVLFFAWVGAIHWKARYGKVDPQHEEIMVEAQAIRRQWAEAAERQKAAMGATPETTQAQLKQQRAAEEARKQAEMQLREALLKDFALRNAPAAWKTLQRLRAEVQLQREQLESLKADMQLFGIQVSTDENVRAFQAQLSELERQRDGVYEKLVEALLAERKAAAAIGRRGYERLRQRALEEGIRRAEEAQRGFQGSQVHGVPAQ